MSGKAIANLATEELKHPAPVFHGDTLFVESEVLEKKESQSKPDRGTVRVHTRVFNQDGVLVAEFKRLVLVAARRDPGARRVGDSAEGNVPTSKCGGCDTLSGPPRMGAFPFPGANLGPGSTARRRAPDDHDRDTKELLRRHEHHRPRPHQERASAGLGR